MRRLVGNVPRSTLDHRTTAGKRYTAAAREVRARYGAAAPAALVRLVARLEGIEIPALEAALDHAVARRRQTEQRRIRRQLWGARQMLVKTDERLAAIAAAQPVDVSAALKAFAGGRS